MSNTKYSQAEKLEKALISISQKSSAKPFLLPESENDPSKRTINIKDRCPTQEMIEAITYNDKVKFSTKINKKDHLTYYYINDKDYPLIQIFHMKHLTSEDVMTTTLSEGRGRDRIVSAETTNPVDLHKLIKKKWKCKELYVYPDGYVFGGKFYAPVSCLWFKTYDNIDDDDVGDDDDEVMDE